MTYSIVAFDPAGPAWGIAVASKFLAAASVVSWARAGAGAVATQALANVAYGREGLDLLTTGMSASEVVSRLTAADPGRADRQLGVVDAGGGAATFTGAACLQWAGGVTGDGYCCQGNILTGSNVVTEAAAAFEDTSGDLATRLVAALEAGDAAGGDARGRQSAGLLVVTPDGGYLASSDVVVDLRVDDHANPVAELRRLLGLHRVLFPPVGSLEFLDLDADLVARVRALLGRAGYDTGSGRAYDEELKGALWAFVGRENLEARWAEGPRIERGILSHLESIAANGAGEPPPS